MNKISIEQRIKDLATAVRDYSKYQVDYWKRVPLLTLKALGEGNVSLSDNITYQLGYLCVVERRYSDSIYVDLETGDIVSLEFNPGSFISHETWDDCLFYLSNNARAVAQQVPDKRMIGLALRIEVLDAKRIIEGLEEKAARSKK